MTGACGSSLEVAVIDDHACKHFPGRDMRDPHRHNFQRIHRQAVRVALSIEEEIRYGNDDSEWGQAQPQKKCSGTGRAPPYSFVLIHLQLIDAAFRLYRTEVLRIVNIGARSCV